MLKVQVVKHSSSPLTQLMKILSANVVHNSLLFHDVEDAN